MCVTMKLSYSMEATQLETECMTVRVFAPDDNLVEGTEVFNAIVSPGASSLTSVSIFIIDNDCEWVLFLTCIIQQ